MSDSGTAVRRKVAIITTGRADYFSLRDVARACDQRGDVEVVLLVCGGHFAASRGESWRDVCAEYGERAVTVCGNLEGDLPGVSARSAGVTMLGMAQALEMHRPDIVVRRGDRFEALAAGFSATQLGLPLVHIHGGEVTHGALDDGLRHALTKLAHLHCVAAEPFAWRVRQMGEPDWRIHVTGAPGLDRFHQRLPRGRSEVEAAIGAPLGLTTVLCTLHTETVGLFDAENAVAAVQTALGRLDVDVIVTAPNQDAGHETLLRRLEAWAAETPRVHFRAMLGEHYPDVMRYCGAVVGNSSSGLIETPSAQTPAVDLGERQAGRLRPRNVLWAPFEPEAIHAAIGEALTPDFRSGLVGIVNPYGDGRACDRIAALLASVELDDRLLRKVFVDLPETFDTPTSADPTMRRP